MVKNPHPGAKYQIKDKLCTYLDFKGNGLFLIRKIMCDQHIHPSHKSNNTNKSNVRTPKQRYSIKPPTEEMDFAVKSPFLAPPRQVYIDRYISSL